MWHWTCHDESGAEVEAPDLVKGQSFPNQSDAETWLGQSWREIRDAGVASVSLHEQGRHVYGPMSLSPAQD
ncbi:MAG: hypothetical protein KDC39_01600 [Actinobacteria bacterium]|nr:hypothetical protein [Actinomycetota bacterium]